MMIDVVAAVLIDHDGKVLIARRKEGKKLGGYWEFPGGKVEKGETPETSLIRELQEEMNIDIEVLKYIGENTHRYDGDVDIRLLAYHSRIVRGQIRLMDHDKVMWVNVDKLLNHKLAPADIPIVDLLL